MPGERTEQATQHRREKARKEGDILHSRELTAAAGTLAGVIALGVLGGRAMLKSWRAAFAGFLALRIAGAAGSRRRLGRRCVGYRRLSLACLGPVAHGDGRGGRGRARSRDCADRRAHLHAGVDRVSSSTASIRLRTSRTSSRCARRRGWASRCSRRRCWRSSPCSASPGS